jgi:LuxR family maltose regulon positive regulatory protein
VAPAYLALAGIRLQQDKVEEARFLLGQGRAAAVEPALRVMLGLTHARLDVTVGRVEAARALLLRLHDEVVDWELPRYLSRWWAMTEAEVALASGKAAPDAERLLDTADREPPFARERLVAARSLLATGEERRADEALSPLLADEAESSFSESDRAEAWLLTALAAHSRREENRATEAVRRAIVLSAENQLWRPFASLDDHLLERLLAPLDAVDPAIADRVQELRSHLSGTVPVAQTSALSVPLTDRELLILRYVPTMMTNTEIAAELFVSVNTVKAHLKHIYRKLDVDTRREAARRAQQLGLLSPPPEDT